MLVSSTAAFAAAWIATLAPAEGPFRAYSWIHVPGAEGRWVTPNVKTMVEIAPWTSIQDAALRLKELAPGDRWVMLFIITDDMANHPADRCMKQVVELRTNYITPRSATAQSARIAKVARTALMKPKPIPVTSRVTVLRATPFRGPWIDSGVQSTRAKIAEIMKGLKAAGAIVDGVIVDNETTLDATHFMGRDGALAAIQADPRWPTLARATGLPLKITGMTWGSPLYFAWTRVMSSRFDRALNHAIYEPVKAAFPMAVVSNYCSGNINPQNAWPDINGHVDVRSTTGFGTHDSHEFYGWLAPGRLTKVRASGSSESSEWTSLRLEVYKIRGMRASSPRPKHAWVASKSWRGETWGRVPWTDHPMWDEMVMQLAMNGVDHFLHFSPYLPGAGGLDSEALLALLARDHQDLDRVLAEINAEVGNASGIPLTVAQPRWDERVIATGRRVGSDIVWRFSFDEGINHVVVAFTDGHAVRIEREPGRCGAWFRHPASKSLRVDPNGRPVLGDSLQSGVANQRVAAASR
jgi:hypothetical protein